MARRQHTKKARKDHGPCRVCRETIEAGQGYYYWEFMHRGTLKVHEGCVGKVRRSWLTGSEIKGTLWDMVDDFIPEGTPEEISQQLTEFAEQVRDDVMDGLLQESMDNIESGIGHTDVPVYEELQERYDELEGWVSEMENAAAEIESAQPEELECECEAEWDAQQEAEAAEAEGLEIDFEVAEWDGECECGAADFDPSAQDWQEQLDAAREVVDQCPE